MKRSPLVFAALTALLSTLPVLAAVPPAAGPDFQVNPGSQGSQLAVDIAQDTSGDTVFVWIDENTVPRSVQARVYAPSGAPLGLSFIVGLESQPISHPRVAMTPLGEFTVVWGNPHTIFVRRFDRLGRPLGSVNTAQQPPGVIGVHSPDVVVDAAGNAYVAWAVSRIAGDLILLQRFDAANQPLGPAQQVNQVAFNVRDQPRLALNPAGSLLVSWNDYRASSIPDIWFRRFDGPSAAWGAETRLHANQTGVQQGSAPLLYPEGDGAVIYTDLTRGALLVRRLDATGAFLGALLQVGLISPGSSGSDLDAAAGPDGTVLAAWQGGDELAHAGFFDRSWNPLQGDFLVSSPYDDFEFDIAVAAGGTGNFAAAWTSGSSSSYFPYPPYVGNGRDGSEYGVFAQRFQAPACAAGSEVLCLDGGRFEARVDWKNPFTGQTGTGKALPLTGDTGSFWFFDAANLELMIKVLDGGAVNGHFWVFYGSLSNVEYTITVTDTETGAAKTYHNAPFQFASKADVEAFPSAPALAPVLATVPVATAPVKLSPPLFCGTTSESLCLAGRFDARVSFVDPRTGSAGQGKGASLTENTGTFWFFDPANLELMVKVLDAQGANGHFWVFYGALSDVEYTITVTDTFTGASRTYHNDPHHLASGADLTAF